MYVYMKKIVLYQNVKLSQQVVLLSKPFRDYYFLYCKCYLLVRLVITRYQQVTTIVFCRQNFMCVYMCAL